MIENLKVCTYCQKNERVVCFVTHGKGEHVIPRFLGDFKLYFKADVVCKECNRKLSKAEGLFKEGSLAGIHSAVYGIDSSKTSVRVRKDRVSWEISSADGNLGVFKDIFPFVKLSDGNTHPKPIIILDHKKSPIKYIFFVEEYAFYAKNKNSKKFKDKKRVIDNLKEKYKKLEISLFGDTVWKIEMIVELLKEYGLKYNKRSEEKFEDTNRGARWAVNYTENGDAETLKIPAKIAFNYFAFCANEVNMLGVLQNSKFDYIRNYVSYGALPPKNYTPLFSYENNPEDKDGFHVITFQKEGNFITSYVTLFGRFNYRVVLAEYPFATQSKNFGCATAFDPFSGAIHNRMYSVPQPIIGKANYGLFCR